METGGSFVREEYCRMCKEAEKEAREAMREWIRGIDKKQWWLISIGVMQLFATIWFLVGKVTG